MKITNIHNLPTPIAKLITKSQTKPELLKFRVTQIINPPLVRELLLVQWDKIQVDVSEFLWQIYGTSVHKMLEAVEGSDILTEQRHDISVDGIVLTGQTDWFDTSIGQLVDYKTTSVWSKMFGAAKDWEKQLNIYAHLWRSKGYRVESLWVYTLLRDWVKPKTYGNDDYPSIPFDTTRLPLWTPEKTQEYIEHRMALFTVPATECTPEEKWSKPTVWAVHKKGVKRAINGGLCSSEAEAYALAGSQKDKCEVEYRPGMNTRCEQYCIVRSVCPYSGGNK